MPETLQFDESAPATPAPVAVQTMPAQMVPAGPPDPMTILARAIESGRSSQELAGLLDLVRCVRAEAAEKEFNAALNAAQKEMPVVVKDKTNKHTKTQYAALETVQVAVKPVLMKNGFSLIYDEEKCDTASSIRMRLDIRHSGGHVTSVSGEFPLDGTGVKGSQMMTGVQAKGSTISYAKRYLLLMAFNIAVAGEDKDGVKQEAEQSPVDEQQMMALEDAIGACGHVGKPVEPARLLKWLKEKAGIAHDWTKLTQINQAAYSTIMKFLEERANSK